MRGGFRTRSDGQFVARSQKAAQNEIPKQDITDTADSKGATAGQSSSAIPSISLPKGGGAIRGIGEKFAANPVTGTGSLNVPISTRPGRSGFGPQLALSYDSGSGNGPFGFGWSLSLPSTTATAASSATSSVHFNADKDEEINLVLQTKRVEKTSEYNQIISDLKSHIRKGLFKGLQENKERQDISYLANKTGWDTRLVAMVSLEDKYGTESVITAGFYFVLFRAGIPVDADGLYSINSKTVKKIWEEAVKETLIEASLKSTIEQNLAKFKESSSLHLLENEKTVGVNLQCGIYAG